MAKKKELAEAIENISLGELYTSSITDDKVYWYDLENMYNNIRQMLASVAKDVSTLSLNPMVLNNLDNPKDLIIEIRGITRIISEILNELEEIHDQHKGKRGLIIDEKDIIDSSRLASLYQTVNDKVISTVMPSVVSVSTIIAECVNENNKEETDHDGSESKPE